LSSLPVRAAEAAALTTARPRSRGPPEEYLAWWMEQAKHESLSPPHSDQEDREADEQEEGEERGGDGAAHDAPESPLYRHRRDVGDDFEHSAAVHRALGPRREIEEEEDAPATASPSSVSGGAFLLGGTVDLAHSAAAGGFSLSGSYKDRDALEEIGLGTWRRATGHSSSISSSRAGEALPGLLGLEEDSDDDEEEEEEAQGIDAEEVKSVGGDCSSGLRSGAADTRSASESGGDIEHDQEEVQEQEEEGAAEEEEEWSKAHRYSPPPEQPQHARKGEPEAEQREGGLVAPRLDPSLLARLRAARTMIESAAKMAKVRTAAAYACC
jgi:hypothetical protein